MHCAFSIQNIYIALLVCILLGYGSPAPNRAHDRNHEGVDLDENYRIEVLHKGNVIDSTKTEKGHHTILTVTVWAFSKEFSLDLRLNSFLFAAGYVEKSFNDNGAVYHDVNHTEKNCFYLGSVRNEAPSSAAISTCEGIVGYFAVGNVSYHIESHSDRLNGPHKVYRSRRDAKGIYRCGNDELSLDTLLNPLTHARRFKRSFVWPQDLDKKNKIVELFVSNDHSQFLNQGSDIQAVIQRTLNIINIANAGYQPIGIYLMCVGIEVWNNGDKISVIPSDKDATLKSWAEYRKRNINPVTYNDNGVLITNNTFNGSVIGLAFVGQMCTNSHSAAFVSDVHPIPSLAGSVMDHEMGHNFGLQHDDLFDPCTCSDASGKCIMWSSSDSAAPPLTWSQCSLDQFSTSFQQGLDLCLYNVPKVVQPNSGYCGNGIVENGEQCDCGNSTSQQCNRACCNANTCQLIAPATCAFGRCCDISTCKLLPCGTLCRKKTDAKCDLDEFCDGSSALCANDTYVPDGTACAVIGTAAYCHNGLCRSHRSQCELLWGPGTLESSNKCYDLNSRGEYYGNCGFNWLPDISYIPCGVSDTKCGLLQCQNLTRELYTYKSFVIGGSNSFNDNDTCHTIILDYGLATKDPGLVPNGAECGSGKMCVNQKCVDVQGVLTANCVGCQANQACNNVGQCQDITPACGQTTTATMPTTRTSSPTTTPPTTASTTPTKTPTTVTPSTITPTPTTTTPTIPTTMQITVPTTLTTIKPAESSTSTPMPADSNSTWIYFGIIFGVGVAILVTSALSCWFCRLQNIFE